MSMPTMEPASAIDAVGRGSQASRLNQKLSAFAADIKITHTVFAMPFALLSTFLAASGWPRMGQLGLIFLCMVSARTVAMAMNRLLDAEIDAQNPRTKLTALPRGKMPRPFHVRSQGTFADR